MHPHLLNSKFSQDDEEDDSDFDCELPTEEDIWNEATSDEASLHGSDLEDEAVTSDIPMLTEGPEAHSEMGLQVEGYEAQEFKEGSAIGSGMDVDGDENGGGLTFEEAFAEDSDLDLEDDDDEDEEFLEMLQGL